MVHFLYKIFVIVVFSFLFVSCWHREKINVSITSDMKESRSLNSLSKTLDMDSYFDSISYIPLDDSNENAFLKDINKCIIKDNRIYVLDFFGTESVKVFDLSGNFLFMVGSKGNGPGEFFRTFDFDVSGSRIFLLDISQKKIIEYSIDNTFIEEYPFSADFSGINSFFVTNNSDFVLGMDKELYDDSKVLLVDKKFKTVERILPFEKNDTEGQLKIGSFRRCGDKIVFYYPVSDDVYLFDESGKINKKYTVSLNSTPIPDDIRNNYRKIVAERKLGGFNYFHETPFFCKNMLVTTIFYGSSKGLFCLDMANNKYAIESYDGVLELFKKLSIHHFNFPIYMDEERIVCVMNQSIYEKMNEKEMIDLSYLEMLNEGGTMLLVYHLK